MHSRFHPSFRPSMLGTVYEGSRTQFRPNVAGTDPVGCVRTEEEAYYSAYTLLSVPLTSFSPPLQAQSYAYGTIVPNTEQSVIREQAHPPYEMKIELESTRIIDGAIKSRGDRLIHLNLQLCATKNEDSLLKGPDKTIYLTYEEDIGSSSDHRGLKLFATVLCQRERSDVKTCPSLIIRTQKSVDNPHRSSAVFDRRRQSRIKLSKGGANIGFYIMLCCPHHNLLHLVLRDCKGKVVAEGISTPVFIKDDRRSENRRLGIQQADVWPGTSDPQDVEPSSGGANSPFDVAYRNQQDEDIQDRRYTSPAFCPSPVDFNERLAPPISLATQHVRDSLP